MRSRAVTNRSLFTRKDLFSFLRAQHELPSNMSTMASPSHILGEIPLPNDKSREKKKTGEKGGQKKTIRKRVLAEFWLHNKLNLIRIFCFILLCKGNQTFKKIKFSCCRSKQMPLTDQIADFTQNAHVLFIIVNFYYKFYFWILS